VDTITHALSGALIARATATSKPAPHTLPVGRRTFVGFAAAAFPDTDFIAGFFGGPLANLYYHRGVTHSLLMLPLWAVLLAVLFAAIWRWRPGWRAYFGVCALGIGIHIAGDWITGYGTMIFAPLSDTRYALSTTFIIDLWFTGIILAGLLGAWIWRRSPVPAIAGLVVLTGYVGLQWVAQQQAIQFGERYARAAGIGGAEVSAVARPVSPFNWTVMVADPLRYHYAHVNLLRTEPRPEPGPDSGFIARLNAPYRPLAEAEWERVERYGFGADGALVREAFLQPEFEFFRWFAAYPARYRVDHDGERACVWFMDLRFVTPGMDAVRGRIPFRYGMCRLNGLGWEPFRLVGDTEAEPLR
jgi:inner membrane protein